MHKYIASCLFLDFRRADPLGDLSSRSYDVVKFSLMNRFDALQIRFSTLFIRLLGICFSQTHNHQTHSQWQLFKDCMRKSKEGNEFSWLFKRETFFYRLLLLCLFCLFVAHCLSLYWVASVIRFKIELFAPNRIHSDLEFKWAISFPKNLSSMGIFGRCGKFYFKKKKESNSLILSLYFAHLKLVNVVLLIGIISWMCVCDAMIENLCKYSKQFNLFYFFSHWLFSTTASLNCGTNKFKFRRLCLQIPSKLLRRH